jgi:hypothetical protein
VAPAITGTARVGETVACDHGTWTDATSYGIAWTLDGGPAAGDAQHAVEPGEAGRPLRCVVYATGPGGQTALASAAVVPAPAPAPDPVPTATPTPPRVPAETPTPPAPDPGHAQSPPPPAVTSPPPAITPPPPAAPPRSLTAPRVRGAARVGATLTCAPGTWSPAPDRVRFTWTRDGRRIAGASGARYRIAARDVGRRIGCDVTATAAGRTSAPARASGVGPVRTAPRRRS